MYFRFFLIKLLISLTCCLNGYNQTINLQAVDYPSQGVQCIYRDHEGFLWTGNAEGLFRYDGNNFKYFTHIQGDTSSLSGNSVYCIGEDSANNLWIGTENGLNRFNRLDETFTAYLPRKIPGSISSLVIKSMLLDEQGNFWIGTRKGLNKLDEQNNAVAFESFFPNREDTMSTSEWSFERLYESSNGEIWGCTWKGGLLHFNPLTKEFTSYKEHSLFPDDNDNIFKTIVEVNDNKLLISTWNQRVLLFDLKEKKFLNNTALGTLISKKLNPANGINDFLVDRENNLWVAHGEGLLVIDLDILSTLALPGKTKESRVESLTNKLSVTSLLEDKEGTVWVGHLNHGLKKYDPEAAVFNKWFVPFKPESNRRDYVTGVLAGQNKNLWIGTWGDGLIHSTHDGSILKRIFPSKSTGSRNSDVIRDLCTDIKGKIWIATLDGLSCYDPVIEKFTAHYCSHPSSKIRLSHKTIVALVPDDDGFIWVVTQEGIHKLDPIHEKLYSPVELGKHVNKKITTLLKDADGNYWFGLYSGLLYHNVKEDTSWLFKSKFGNTNSISSNSIRNISESKDNKLWISTSAGLSVYDREKKRFSNLFQEDGLPTNIIQNTLEDVNHDIWVLSKNNISRYDTKNNVFINYNEKDGLTGEEHHIFKGENGYIYLGSEKGFFHFHPDSIEVNTPSHPVVITDFILFGKNVAINGAPLNGEVIRYKKQLVLEHDQSMFGFRFALLDLTSNENVSYFYKLEGYNSEWINIGSKTEVEFQNLKFGDYKLLLKASRGSRVLSNSSTSLDIKILPPFWLTWYAFVGYGLITLFILYLYRSYTIYRERVNTKLQLEQVKADKARELDQMKLNFFINVSHELRTPLTLINGPLEQVIRSENNPEKLKKLEIISRNSKRLLHLIGQLLDTRKLEVKKYQPRIIHGNVQEFCKQLLQSFHAYAIQQNLTFISKIIPQASSFWFYADALEKILSNFLINAFKFTPAEGQVVFEMKEQLPEQIKAFHHQSINNGFHLINNETNIQDANRYLQFKVSDTGCGMDANEIFEAFERFHQHNTNKYSAGYGIGLSLTKDLANASLGRIYARGRKGEGTEFVLFFPVYTEALNDSNQVGNEDDFVPNDYLPLLNRQRNRINNGVETSEIKKSLDENNGQREKILIVDDNPDLLDYVSSILEEDYLLFFAENGAEALKKCRETLFHLIITDIMMPVMDGLELCAQLKEDINTSHIPIVLLTARSGTENELQGLETGADDYISKPFNSDVLKRKVKNIIESRKKLWAKVKTTGKVIPEGLHLTRKDSLFLEKVVEFVEKNISDPGLNQDKICSELGLSRTQLYRKLNSLANQSVNEFIRNIRLHRASEILRCGNSVHIAELAYTVGFSEHSYFSKMFRKKYGLTPKEYNKEYTRKKQLDGGDLDSKLHSNT